MGAVSLGVVGLAFAWAQSPPPDREPKSPLDKASADQAPADQASADQARGDRAAANNASADNTRTDNDQPDGSSKPQPKFEPREKFDDDPPSGAARLPAPPGQLDHAVVGPRGTLHLCGGGGTASFLWPVSGREAKFYHEPIVLASAADDGLVYRLGGRLFRVWFKIARQPDGSGRFAVWIKNGDKDWQLYQRAVVAVSARK